MKIFLYVALSLLLLSSVKSLKLNYEGECGASQLFEVGKEYVYEYSGIIEPGDRSKPMRSESSLQIRCDEVRIRSYSRCSAQLSLESCSVTTHGNENESGFEIRSHSKKLVHKLERGSIYFHYNGVKITRVMHHQNEKPFITNIKKAIIAKLLAKFRPADQQIEVSSNYKDVHTISVSSVNVVNDEISEIEVTIRSQQPTKDLKIRVPSLDIDSVTNSFTQSKAYDYFPFIEDSIGLNQLNQIVETCNYQIKRNRFVKSVSCVQDMLLQKSTITLELKSVTRSKSISSREKNIFSRNYVDTGIKFSELQSEVLPLMKEKFDAVQTFVKAITAENYDSAALFGKLEKWVTEQDSRKLMDTWRDVENYILIEEIPSALNIWTDLLLSCIDNKWVKSSDEWNDRQGCQMTLNYMLERSEGNNKDALLNKIAEIKHPSHHILSTLMNTPVNDQTPAWVIALEKTIKNHELSPYVNKNSNVILRAKDIIVATIVEHCSSKDTNEDHFRKLEAALSSFSYIDDMAEGDVVYSMCWNHVSQHKVQANKAVISLVETANVKEDFSQLISVMSDESYSSQVIISSFLYLLTNQGVTKSQLKRVMQNYQAKKNSSAKKFMKEFVESQISLTDSGKSLLSKSASDYLGSLYPDVPVFIKKEHTTTIPFSYFLPLGPDIKVDVSTLFQNEFPQVIELHATVPQIGLKVVDLEVHLSGFKTSLEKLFKSDGELKMNSLDSIRNPNFFTTLKSFFQKKPNLDFDTMESILNIKNELSFFTFLNNLKLHSPYLSLKILGKDVSHVLSSAVKITPGQLFNLLEQLEQGVKTNTAVYNSPLFLSLSQHNSLGLPQTTSVGISMLFKSLIDSLTDISKFFFTGSSDNHLKITTSLEFSVLLESIVNPYKTIAAGLGAEGSYSASFSADYFLETSPNNFELKFIPGKKDRISVFQFRPTRVPWSHEYGVDSVDSKIQENAYDFPKSYFWTGLCDEATMDSNNGAWCLGVIANRPNIEVVVKGTYKEDIDNLDDLAHGVVLSTYAQNTRTGEPYFSLSFEAMYHPQLSTTQFGFSINNGPMLQFKAGYDLLGDDLINFDQLLVTLNASTYWGDQPIVSAKLIKVDSENELASYELLFNAFRFSITATYKQFTEDTILFDLQRFDAYSTPTAKFVYGATNIQSGNKNGKNVTILWNDLENNEAYNFFTTALATNDLDEYTKVIHAGNQDKWGSYWFMDGRMDISSGNPGMYDWMATLTNNFVQAQFNVDGMNEDDVTVKVDLIKIRSKKEMTRELAQTSQHTDVRYPPTGDQSMQTLVKFTKTDAALPSDIADVVALNSFVISTKDFCSPCYAGSIFYNHRKYFETELNDNGRILNGFIRHSLSNQVLNFEVDRSEKSVTLSNKVSSLRSSYYNEKIKFSLNRVDQTPGELEISTFMHNNKFNLEGNFKFVDVEAQDVFTSTGLLGEMNTNFTDKSGVYMCWNNQVTCDPLERPNCGNDRCKVSCKNDHCCTYIEQCCQDTDCSKEVVKVWKEQLKPSEKLRLTAVNVFNSPTSMDFESFPQVNYLVKRVIGSLLLLIDDEKSHGGSGEIADIKISLRKIFEQIYYGELAMAQLMSTPANFANQLHETTTLYYRDFINQLFVQPHQGAAFVTHDNGQFVTMNGHYHNIPSIPNTKCSWLANTDILEDSVNVIMKRDSTFYTIGDETVEITMDGRAFKSNDGNSEAEPIDFPFFFKLVTCSKPHPNVIECKGMHSHARFVYYPETGVTTIYGDMRGEIDNIQGSIGFPMNNTEVPELITPDGSVATNQEEFLNSWELSGNSRCYYNEQRPTIDLSYNGDNTACIEAFSPFKKFVEDGTISQGMLNSYISACQMEATTHSQTCHYTDMLAFTLRKQGYPVDGDYKCLSCGSVNPVRSVVKENNIAFMVSLSEDHESFNPIKSIKSIVNNIEENVNGATQLSYSVVTFGGNLHLYEPHLSSYNYREVSFDKSDLFSKLEELKFNGPAYESSQISSVVDYSTRSFTDAHKGVSRTIVIVAPQQTDEKIGAIARVNPLLVSSSLTNMYMMSNVASDEQEAQVSNKLFSSTGGASFSYDEADELSSNIYRDILQMKNASIECVCNVYNKITGAVRTTCNKL